MSYNEDGRKSRWPCHVAELKEKAVQLPEDYFQTGAFALAGAAATVTTRIGLGFGVVNPDTRHPALLAMETATREFGPEIAELVDGVTKIGKLAFSSREESVANTNAQTRTLAAPGADATGVGWGAP